MENFKTIENQILKLKSRLNLNAKDFLSVYFYRDYTEKKMKFKVKVLVDSTGFEQISSLNGAKIVENQLRCLESEDSNIIDRLLTARLNGVEYRCIMSIQEYNDFMGNEV